jgi:hypothetical protein
VSRYRETLNRWASQHVPDGAQVIGVDVDYDDGWDPTFTSGPETLSVTIRYTHESVRAGDGYAMLEMKEMTSIGDLLTELFAIEEAD